MDYVLLVKMVIVCNAIQNGWNVKLLSPNEIQFKKPRTIENETDTPVQIQSYIKQFMVNNMKINQMTRNIF